MNSDTPIPAAEAAGDMPDPQAMAATLSPQPPAQGRAPRRGRAARSSRKTRWGWLRLLLSLCLVALAVGFAALALTGATLRLPVWAVAEAEARMNRAVSAPGALPGASVSLGGAEVTVDRDWVPRLMVEDLRLVDPAGRTMLALPELALGVDPGALLTGKLRPQSLRVLGAQVTLVRLADGRFDLAFGAAGGEPLRGVADLIERVEAVFAQPMLTRLDRIDVEGLTLTLDDRRAGRVWEMGDGRLTIENRADEIALGLGVGLVAGGAAPARAEMTFVSRKDSAEARMSARIEGVAAADLAAQAPALAFLSVLNAPISGRFSGALDAQGQPGVLQGGLEIGAGVLQPTPETNPIRFDHAGLAFDLDLAAGKIVFSELSVDGPSLRLDARGQSFASDVVGGLPRTFLSQVQINDLQVDPAGLFQEPVRFSEGAIDLRLRLNPFQIEIGQVALREEGRQLLARGRAAAEPQGWSLALDLSLNEIRYDRLLALWPVGLVAKTREWLVDNVQQGLLFDVQAALRLSPGQEPRLSLGYEFAGTDVRVVKTLPPVREGVGHATISDLSYVLALDEGNVTPPVGGVIDVAGSVFRVRNITARPATADLTLNTRSSVTAALSLLDEPPFGFLTKAGRAVDIAEGRAVTRATLTLPLKPHLMPDEIEYSVFGTLYDVASDKVVPGRVLTSDQLVLVADRGGLAISGPGRVDGLPLEARFSLPFGANAGGSRVEGKVELSPAFLSTFSIGLPKDMVTGKGMGRFALDLPRGGTGSFTLASDLAGLALRVPALGWSKPPGTTGTLDVAGRFGSPPVVDRLSLAAAGLRAEGSVTLRPGGELDMARFSNLTLNNWLNVAVNLRGRGAGRDVAIEVTGGRADLRGLPDSGGGGGAGASGPPLTLALDRLSISDGIALTGFHGNFTQSGGFAGDFTGRVNGVPLVEGAVTPSGNGSAVRISSQDAGAVLKAAGIFETARGGAMDLLLTPSGPSGHYDGSVRARNLLVVDAPVLAELLSVISVVGLLDQLNSAGLVFATADAEFRLTPDRVEIIRGAAVGASLGVSMEGVYQLGNSALRLRGVISPIYLLNGIGSLFTKRGEGVFGFNYEISGTAAAPQVSVNPLSILTPGMFREIFRQPLPKAGTAP